MRLKNACIGKMKKLFLLLSIFIMAQAVYLPEALLAADSAASGTAPETAAASTKSKKTIKTGWYTKKGHIWYFTKKGKKVTGWKKIKGKKYYFRTSGKYRGTAVTGWMKQGKAWYYFGRKGVYHPEKSANANRYSDKTGSAKQKTIRRAKAIVSKITNSKMSKAQKLRVCFDYVMKTYTGRRPRTPHYCGTDWPVVYANDMFLDGSGNCFSYAAAFGYLAKACGYTNVYCCNSTGHGWTEINGLIYDPEEYRNTARKYYGTPYSAVPSYRQAIAANLPGMHVKL